MEYEWLEEKNERCALRHELSVGRLEQIAEEDMVEEPYRAYFQDMAMFLVKLESVRRQVADGSWEGLDQEKMQEMNRLLYSDILPENYEKSYANPAWAVLRLGEEYGPLFCAVCAELRGGIGYAFENRMDYLTILNELLIEIYTCFEEEVPEYKTVKHIFYWYASDYCDVFLADRIKEQIDPKYSFAADMIMNADLDDERYLYRFGEYITENELQTARYLKNLPRETLQQMADVFTEGYRNNFINAGEDLSKKSVINIRYAIGFERMIRLAVRNFEKMGLKPVIYRADSGVITKQEQNKTGYYGTAANPQYDYDHREDQALILDKRYVERKLDVLKNVYEKEKAQAAQSAGAAAVEFFGGKQFSPVSKPEAPSYTEEQRSLKMLYDSRSGQITHQYIKDWEYRYNCTL